MTGAPLGDLDLDDLPTGTAVRVLLRLVINTTGWAQKLALDSTGVNWMIF